MKIRIVKSSNNGYWYADKIGEVFEVQSETERTYAVKTVHVYVDKSDAEEVIEHNSQLYRKVDRPVREGDTVLITKYDNDSVHVITTIEDIDYEVDMAYVEASICNTGYLDLGEDADWDEYFVLEAIDQPVQPSAPSYAEVSELLHEAKDETKEDDDIITHNGKQYRKVKRKAAVGELVYVITTITTSLHNGYEVGDVFEVTSLYGGGIEIGNLRLVHEEYEVLEPIEQSSHIEMLTEVDLIANLAQEVAKLKRQLTNAQSDIADLEDRLDENEKDTEEVIGRMNDLGDGAEVAAVDLEAFLIELKEDQVAADKSYDMYEKRGDKEMAQFFDGKATGFKIAARRLEEALRNG